MKLLKRIKSLFAVLVATLFVFCFTKNVVRADNVDLGAGDEIANTVEGNLNNVNIKIEITTAVNLDGTNNALLVGLRANDGTVLTDDRFIVAAGTVYDADSIAVTFENAPAVIGTKVAVEENYKYTIETRDFTVVDGTKDIAKLVVIGAGGADVTATVAFTEVKYAVKFGDAAAVDYSYNAVIEAPAQTPAYIYEFAGHQAVDGWTDGTNMFVEGTTKAVADVNYVVHGGTQVNHTWNDVNEVAATAFQSGCKAHQACACGALRENAQATALCTAEDLVIAPLGHDHTYEATFDWTNATNPGDKPAVTFTCSSEVCGHDSRTIDVSNITIYEKANSRTPATCAAAGSVTYVATATYGEVEKTNEHAYVLEKLAHDATHVPAVANSLEQEGNVEYWYCEDCEGYFLDEELTQQVEAKDVVLAKYTLEEAQIVSAGDLTVYNDDGSAGKSGQNLLLLGDSTYSYTLTKPNKSTSIEFNWYLDDPTSDNRIKFHNYFCKADKWTDTQGIWFVNDQNLIMAKDVVTDKWPTVVTGIQFTQGYHKIGFSTQAVMNGNVATGDYVVTIKYDGNVVYTYTQHYDSSKMEGIIFINGSNENGHLYDIDWTGDIFEETQTINVYDLNPLGKISNCSETTTFTYTPTVQNSTSRIFEFNIKAAELTSKSELIVNIGSYGFCRVWQQKGATDKLFFAWEVDGKWTDRYYYVADKSVSLQANTVYHFEMGRQRVTNGLFNGKDYTYLKVNGEYLVNKEGKTYRPSWFYIDPTSSTGLPNTKANTVDFKCVDYAIYDVNYVEPTFETADIISVNDLVYDGAYQNGQIDLTDQRVYNYTGTSTYGSTIFKGVFNIPAADYDTDKKGFQVRFAIAADNWGYDGAIWFHPIVGIIIYKPAQEEGKGEIVCQGYKFPTGKDVNVEIGRLAIMDNDQFSGKHYFYVSVDGVVVAEYLTSGLTEELYSQDIFFLTGSELNGNQAIKNVEIKKTVTVKVGTHTETVDVVRSSLMTLPTFDTTVVPTDKMITGWKIEGTDTAFNPTTDRVFGDVTIVATVEDFKWTVKFGDDSTYVANGAEIVVPEENPTKAADATNHYVFDCWVDGEGVAFVTGTKASADVTYTAKFTAIAHTFGQWVVDTNETCTVDGTKHRTCDCGYEEQGTIAAHHTLEHHDALAATCTADGHVEYYACTAEGCGKYFADANATTELTAAQLVVAAHHTLEHHDALAATCTAEGHVEYYACTAEGCGKYFADANATTELTAAQLVVAKTVLTHHVAVAPTCTKDGTIEYWSCGDADCGKLYADANATTELTAQQIIDPKHHTLTHVEAVAATCEEEGNVEYWYCTECGKYFNEDGDELDNVVVEATGHHFGDNHKCDNCGIADPDYKPSWFEKLTAGCKSSVNAATLAVVLLAAIAVLFYKKRKEAC